MFDRALPALWLEQMRLGDKEVPPDPDVEAQVNSLQESDAQILAAYPPATVVPQIVSRVVREAVPSRRKATLSAVAALATLVFFLYDPAEETRMKGEPNHPLTVYRKSGGVSEKLPPDAAVKAGDQIQLSYFVPQPVYGMIFSVDGLKKITLHYPPEAGTSPQLVAGKEMRLPHAFELDSSPGFEKFILATSPTPFDVNEVLSRTAAGLPLQLTTETFLLSK